MREIQAQLKIQVIQLPMSSKVLQIFEIKANKRDYKFINDPRFIINKKLQERIDENYIGDGKDIIYKETLRELDTITIIYETHTKVNISPKYFKLISTIPSSTGCDDCAYRNEGINAFPYCDYMMKILEKYKTSCQYFKQKKIIKS
jgi:hypothetical protein